jgi:hypothetical protein
LETATPPAHLAGSVRITEFANPITEGSELIEPVMVSLNRWTFIVELGLSLT